MKNPLDSASDEDLVHLAQQNPQGAAGRDAASRLFIRYHARLYAWCFRQVRQRDAALDLAQETMLAAYRALPSFEGRSRFSSWLFAIARYRYLSAARAPRLLVDDDQDLDDLPRDQPDPEEAMIHREDEERALALLETVLEPDERLAFWLRCYERKSVDEITRCLKIESRSGARGLLQNARRKLRAALQRGASEQREEPR